jgi:hypothetical protein
MIKNERIDTRRPRTIEPRHICFVRDYDRNLRIEGTLGDRVHERLKITASA